MNLKYYINTLENAQRIGDMAEIKDFCHVCQSLLIPNFFMIVK